MGHWTHIAGAVMAGLLLGWVLGGRATDDDPRQTPGGICAATAVSTEQAVDVRPHDPFKLGRLAVQHDARIAEIDAMLRTRPGSGSDASIQDATLLSDPYEDFFKFYGADNWNEFRQIERRSGRNAPAGDGGWIGESVESLDRGGLPAPRAGPLTIPGFGE